MKFFIFAASIFAAFTGSSSAVEDSCVLIDFITQETEFTELNQAIEAATAGKLLSSVLGKFDPLVRSNIPLHGFNFSAFGQNLTISIAVDSINITGLANMVPQHINVMPPNSVGIGTNSSGQVHVDATMSATVVEMEKSATVNLQFVLEQPILAIDVEANMYACSPGVSDCSNITIAGLQTQLESTTRIRDYASIMKELLMKFKDASLQFLVRSLLRLMPDFSAEEINKKGTIYDTYLASLNSQAPTLLNYLINFMVKPWFGATCLSEK
ncbi:hypothetical protein V7S43_015322 [Phytophthora oleae]|uniref:Lipid-binding serum glycoprotein N-terminal domain-containing protein n=1 Tax=Phytophthora oleae TaxID=2107226 RepID=A0ABD3EYX8_9STRA